MTALFQPLIELFYGGQWNDVTGDTYTRDGISITRGRSDEGARVDPSKASVTFNNRGGRYSPRNPTSPLYGLIGRNTPLRVSLAIGDVALDLSQDGPTTMASTPSAAAFAVTDLDARVDARADTWTGRNLIGREDSWAFYLNNGYPRYGWSTDGVAFTYRSPNAQVPQTPGRRVLRVTHDVDNGLGGSTITFYYGDSLDGPWTQIGDPVVEASPTSIFVSSDDLRVGNVYGIDAFIGQIYAAQLRDGIDGTIVAGPDFSAQSTGTTVFADGHSNVWSLSGTAEITRAWLRSYRFVGEVSSWPQRWDHSGRDVWTPVEAAGIMRRLGQGASPIRSVWRTGVLSGPPGLIAYWPCEDLPGSTSIASGLAGQAPITVIGSPKYGEDTAFASSDPLPVLNGARLLADSTDTGTGQIQIRFLLSMPAAPSYSGILMTIVTGGSVAYLILNHTAGGQLELIALDANENTIGTTNPTFDSVHARPILVSIEVYQDGPDVELGLFSVEPNGTGGSAAFATLTGRTITGVQRMLFNQFGGYTDIAIGHVDIHDTISGILLLGPQLGAWLNETAGRRIERLCAEEGIALSTAGDLDDTAPMGPQRSDTLLSLLGEASDADAGLLYEPRDMLGLAYRTRDTLYNQEPAVSLDYTAGTITDIEPIDDDQATRNDITVTRKDGSSARAVLEAGPLSVDAPPDGVGRYDESVTLNVHADAVLPDHAGWRLHLGTVDEARYPTIGLQLGGSAYTSDPAVTSAVREVNLGDRLTVSNPPEWLPPGEITQLVQGYTETLGLFHHDLTINCSPEMPYHLAEVEHAAYGYVGSDGSTLAATFTAGTDTSMSVAVSNGYLWTSSDAPFDLMVAGVRLTVTAITGASSPQAFTVAQSPVNGVEKTIPAGATVDVYPSSFIGL